MLKSKNTSMMDAILAFGEQNSFGLCRQPGSCKGERIKTEIISSTSIFQGIERSD
jgi:hypothetical protein